MVITAKRKPLEYYLKLRYPITLTESPEGGYFVEIIPLEGCMSQGETVQEAVDNIKDAKKLWLEIAYEEGIDIPEP
jgi:antitoxin HicB